MTPSPRPAPGDAVVVGAAAPGVTGARHGEGGGRGTAPSAEELAAIVAAVAAVWPRPAVAPVLLPDPTTPAWRFSGRWWHRRPAAVDAGVSAQPVLPPANTAGSGWRTAWASSSR